MKRRHTKTPPATAPTLICHGAPGGICNHRRQLEQRLADLQLLNEAHDNTHGGMAHDNNRAHAPYLAGEHVKLRADQPTDAGEAGVPFLALTVIFLAMAVSIALFAPHHTTPAPAPAPTSTTTASVLAAHTHHAADRSRELTWCPLTTTCPPIVTIPTGHPHSRARRPPWRVAAAGHGTTNSRTRGEKRRDRPASTATARVRDSLLRIATCESTNRWHLHDDGVNYGGLQFDIGTWISNGGGRYADRADHATKEQQLTIGAVLVARRGYQPWPYCRRYA